MLLNLLPLLPTFLWPFSLHFPFIHPLSAVHLSHLPSSVLILFSSSWAPLLFSYSTVIVSLISTPPYDLCALGSLFPSLSNSSCLLLILFYILLSLLLFCLAAHAGMTQAPRTAPRMLTTQISPLTSNTASCCFITCHLFHLLGTEQERYLLGTISTYVQKRLTNGCWHQWILS